MPKYVAFLRAINVGGHTVKMDHLRSLFAAMGFTNVETFIASGNVIFDSPSKTPATLERKIEKHLFEALGYKVATFLRSVPELTQLVQYQPFPPAELAVEGNTLFIGFLANSPGEEAQKKLTSFVTNVEDFHFYGREVFWLYRKKLGESDFPGARIEKTLGMPATLRNSNTVRRIVEKYS
ncbi:MAG: DUF1697 domain-containing protein [Pyrinomonadaceae bacterium]